MRQVLCVALMLSLGFSPSHAIERRLSSQQADSIARHSRLIDANNLQMGITNDGRFSPHKISASDPTNACLRYKTQNDYLLYDAGLVLGAKVNGTPLVMPTGHDPVAIPGVIDESGQAWGAGSAQFRTYKIGTAPDLLAGADYIQWPVAYGAPANPDGSPHIGGDQTLFCVFNDAVDTTSWGQSRVPLDAEIRLTAWAWNDVDDILFLRWQIINKGTHPWCEAAVGLWADCEIQNARDDAVGSDSSLSMVYGYNRESQDNYTPEENNMALGFQLVETPVRPETGAIAIRGRQRTANLANTPATSPIVLKAAVWGWENWGNFESPPHNEETYLRLLGLDTQGNLPVNPVTGQTTAWCFTGDPITQAGWLDPLVADKRFWISAGPFDMAPGDTQYVALAVLTGKGPAEWDGVRRLRSLAPLARAIYQEAGALYIADGVVDPSAPFDVPLMMANPDVAVTHVEALLTLPDDVTLLDCIPTPAVATLNMNRLDGRHVRLNMDLNGETAGPRSVATLRLETTRQAGEISLTLSEVNTAIPDFDGLHLAAFTRPLRLDHTPQATPLLSPADGAVLDQRRTTFAWEPSEDVENDSLLYNLIFIGTKGSDFSYRIDDNQVALDILPSLEEGVSYAWTVTVDDGTHRIASPDTFHFSLPRGFYSGGVYAKNAAPLSLQGTVCQAEIEGTTLYVLSRLTAFDGSTSKYRLTVFTLPSDEPPVALGSWDYETGPFVYAYSMTIANGVIYLRLGETLLILDAHDPAQIRQVQSLSVEYANRLAIQDHRLIESPMGGVSVYDISDPANPLLDQEISIPDAIYTLVRWPYLISSHSDGTLRLYRVGEDGLETLASFTPADPVLDLAIDENNLLVVTQREEPGILMNGRTPLAIYCATVLNWKNALDFVSVASWEMRGYRPDNWRFQKERITAFWQGRHLIFTPNPGDGGPALERVTPSHNGIGLVQAPRFYTVSSDSLFIDYADALPGGDFENQPAEGLRLSPGYPNPFQDGVTVPCYLPEEGILEVDIFNLLGQRIRSWTESVNSSSPWHAIHWDGRDRRGLAAPAGLYFCRVTSGNKTKAIKVIKY